MIEDGFNVVVGSPGPDHVTIWGGLNIVALGDGDNTIEVRAPSTTILWAGPGDDAVCSAVRGEGVLLSFEGAWGRESPCFEWSLGDLVQTEVVAVLSGHRPLLVQAGNSIPAKTIVAGRCRSSRWRPGVFCWARILGPPTSISPEEPPLLQAVDRNTSLHRGPVCFREQASRCI